MKYVSSMYLMQYCTYQKNTPSMNNSWYLLTVWADAENYHHCSFHKLYIWESNYFALLGIFLNFSWFCRPDMRRECKNSKFSALAISKSFKSVSRTITPWWAHRLESKTVKHLSLTKFDNHRKVSGSGTFLHKLDDLRVNSCTQ